MNIIDKFHNWRRKQRWNKQYRKGRWDNLKGEKESGRYKKLVEYTSKYGSANPDILDLGCGEGVLLDYFDTLLNLMLVMMLSFSMKPSTIFMRLKKVK